MFLDFNIPYPKKGNILEAEKFNFTHHTACAGQRVRASLVHLANIPVKLINTIVELVKILLLSSFAAISFGQSRKMNEDVVISAKKLNVNIFKFATSILGIFIPINANNWQQKIHAKIFKNYVKTNLEKLTDGETEVKKARYAFLTDLVTK